MLIEYILSIVMLGLLMSTVLIGSYVLIAILAKLGIEFVRKIKKL